MKPIVIIALAIFILGLIFYARAPEVAIPKSCPNLLIEKEGKLYLYNSKAPKVEGKNPVMFNNLEEYDEFLKW